MGMRVGMKTEQGRLLGAYLTREGRGGGPVGEGIEVQLGHVECEKPMRHSVGAFLKAGGYIDQEDRREVCTRVTGKF